MKLNWLYIAWRNLGLKKLQTSLSLVLLAFGVGLVSLLMLSEKQLSETFNRNIEDIDLVLGAKGSPLQLILANVYHVDAPTGNIRLADAEKVKREIVFVLLSIETFLIVSPILFLSSNSKYFNCLNF